MRLLRKNGTTYDSRDGQSKLPDVIDNQTHVLADISKGLLTERKGRSPDVATAYFTAHSVEQLRFMSYGIDQARRGWLEKNHVINTLSWPQFQQWLERQNKSEKIAPP